MATKAMSKHNPTCSVCNSGHRNLIESMILLNKSMPEIQREILERFTIKYNLRALYAHKKKHMGDAKVTTEAVANQIMVSSEMKSINELYKIGKLDMNDKASTLNMLLSKVIGFIEMLENIPPHQLPHKTIQGYIGEARGLVRDLAALEGVGTGGDVMNVSIINMEISTFSRAVAAVVKEMFPGQEPEFARRVMERLASIESSIIDTSHILPHNNDDEDGIIDGESTDS